MRNLVVTQDITVDGVVEATDGGDIVCPGSTTVCRALAAAGLVENTTFASGALLVRYRTD